MDSANALQTELEDLVEHHEIDLFGIADLTEVHDFVLRQGGDCIASFPRAISIGMRLIDGIIDNLYKHEDPSTIFSYRALYNTTNANLDRVSLLMAKKIQKAGFKAYPIPASQSVDKKKLEGAISHKLAAHLAGHGWIGKSCLLITPQYGPRARLATILTDAPLETGEPIPDDCDECRECVNICPPKAFTGVSFNPSEPRSVRFRAHLCRDYTQSRTELLGEVNCGLCVYICPYGSQNKKQISPLIDR